jgi:CheY-like chemotaxis protein
VLVVDNEEADRRLLADVLGPLGFEVTIAASGEEALQALALAPVFDAVFVDLAMPGIDGWETIRRLRAAGHRMPVAVVSANAFDKRLDHDVGLPADDFLVKPVRVDELLDWLGRALQLDWRYAPPAPAEPTASAGSLPPPAMLRALQEALSLGHVRGVARRIDAIVAADPAHAVFAARLRLLARDFRYDAMTELISKALHEPRAA